MTRLSIRCAVFLLPAVMAASLSAQTNGVGLLLGKARSLEARGRMDLASQNWNQVLLVDPNQVEALAGLARLAKQNGDAAAERTYLGRLRRIDPKNPAIAAIERLHVLSAQERSRLDEAVRLTAAHKPNEALRIYKSVFGDEPPTGKWAEDFYETLATSTGGRPDAIAQLRALAARAPDNEVYRLWLARILTYEPNTRAEGLRLLESIRDSGTVEQARGVWRRALVWEKDNPAAKASLEAYVQRYPDAELGDVVKRVREREARAVQSVERQQGFRALRDKDIIAAQERFESVLRRSPADVDAMAGLGFVRLDQKRFDEAVSVFDRARQLAPTRADIREGYENAKYWSAMQRGAVLKTRDPQAAIAAFETALAIRPGEERPVLDIGQIMLGRKDLSGAAARFEQVLRASPSNGEAMAGLGFVRLNEKRFDDAATLLDRARTLAPGQKAIEDGFGSARFWSLMSAASIAVDANRPQAALTGYQEALKLNPNAVDALRGLAGVAERAGQISTARSAYERLTAVEPAEPGSWLGLIRVQLTGNEHAAALETSRKVPPAVRRRVETRADYLALVALATVATSRDAEADPALTRALDAAQDGDSQAALDTRLLIASLLMKNGRTDRAVEVYARAADLHPGSVLAWQGLIGAYSAGHEFKRAIAAVRAMPSQAYESAAANTGFLNAVAAAYASDGNCGQAERTLQRSIETDRVAGRTPSPDTQLQLAAVWMRQRRYDQARAAYQGLVNGNDASAAAWRGYLTVLHETRDGRSVAAAWGRIPASTRKTLERDADMLNLVAAGFTAAGDGAGAVRVLEQTRALYTGNAKPVPVDLDVQLGWALLASARDATLGELLASATARTDLTAAQRAAIDDVRYAWTLQRAQAALAAKDPARAVSILTEGLQALPGRPAIPAALAAVHVQQRAPERALAVYRSWGMSGADAADFLAAAGAALTVHDAALADSFLHEGLKQFPSDRDLLHMTGKRAIAQRQYGEAERLLTAALKGRVSAPRTRAVADAPRTEAAAAESTCRQESTRVAPSVSGFRIVNARFTRSPQTSPASAQTSSTDGEPSTQPPSPPPSPADERAEPQDAPQDAQDIQNDIDALRHRNTPFLSAGGGVATRSGDPGVSRLVIRDAMPGGSVTLANRMRVGVDLHAVSLDGGVPDGLSKVPFGTAPGQTVFAEQSARGTGGELQISSATLGVAIGRSPSGFLTETWTGGFRASTASGGVVLLAERDRVKDSLLSYAGARDPRTGTVWGGVASNAVSVRIGHDVSGTGQYLSVGAAGYEGTKVPDNWSADASAGAYWSVPTGGRTSLTAGFNLTAMHYHRNLSMFSLGHGGYFSPQKYAQVSIPISSSARYDRVSYEFRASPGVQYFTQDSSAFYPGVSPDPSQVYQADKHRGPAYTVAARVDIRLTPHWYVGAFGSANNTRDFQSRSAGVTLKLLARRLPPNADLDIKSVPDWRGTPPLGR